MPKYNIHAAKTHFSKLLAQVADGEEVVICRNDQPVARLVPVAAEALPIHFGASRDKFKFDKELFDSGDAEFAELFGVT